MTAIDEYVFANSEGLEPDAYVVATYLLQGPADGDGLARAAAIATEQTVGRSAYRVPGLEAVVRRHGGRLLALFSVPDHHAKPTAARDGWRFSVARVAFPVANTGYQIPMLLTMLLGDVSLSGIIKLVEVELPRSFLSRFQGPKFGLEGVRLRLAAGRPLVCSILKPCVGVGPAQAGEIFFQHALGGADIIKDDELMVYGGGLRLEDRVKACRDAARRAYEITGEHVLYLVSITDRPDCVVEKARRAVAAGATGLMLTPLSAGISTLQMVAEDPAIQVPIFAHPALLGAASWSPDFGLSEHILAGKLFRLAGADINAFPAPYGRFAHLRDQFIRLFHVSRAPMAHIKPAMSQAGGGLNPINIANVMADVGHDVILVVGGSVLEHPQGVSAGIRAVRQAIDAHMAGRPLADAARQQPELRAAWERWGAPPAT